MTRMRKFPSGQALIDLQKAEPLITRQDLAMIYGVQGPCVDRNLRAMGAWASKNGKPAYFVDPEEVDAPPTVTAKKRRQIADKIKKMHRADPGLTAADVRSHFGIGPQASHRAIAEAGVKLKSSKRRLPHDDLLIKEIGELGISAVAEKYGVFRQAVYEHAQRLGLEPKRSTKRRSANRLLPPDDVLAHEFGLFTPGEIAKRHGVSYQSVLEARVRLDVPAQSARMPHALIPSGMTSIIANAIGHLDAYRSSIAATDERRAQALLADIEHRRRRKLDPIHRDHGRRTQERVTMFNRANLPDDIIAAIEAKGWSARGTSAYSEIFFFDRPGFWLRIRDVRGAWYADISPEKRRPCDDREAYAAADIVLDFRGRGANSRARVFAVAVIKAERPWLADLGIELDHVTARLYSGSGRGGIVTDKPFSPEWMAEFTS